MCAHPTLTTAVFGLTTHVGHNKKSCDAYITVHNVTRGKRRQQVNKAVVESKMALEDSGAVAVQYSQWKRSRRQWLQKATAAGSGQIAGSGITVQGSHIEGSW